MPRVFLTARWANLVIVSYHVPESLLRPRLPEGLELDPICGQPTVSLVAFEFLDTRVWGVPWPGFVNFPEWNLRFYVREKSGRVAKWQSGEVKPASDTLCHSATSPLGHFSAPRRGVVFIREFVPSRITASLARRIYNEPYSAAAFSHEVRRDNGLISARYSVRFGGREHTLHARACDELLTPDDGCTEHLLKEHQWGFGTTRRGETLAYEVAHPKWRIFRDAAYEIDVDWATMYGREWAIMQKATPFSTLLVKGSDVRVFGASAE